MPEPTTLLQCGKCSAPIGADEGVCRSCGARVEIATDPAAVRWNSVVDRLQAATLGEFEVSHELGRGGMAAVYLAHEIALNRLVAIKVMAPGLFLGVGMIERFRQEAVTVANLSHPNIITIHAVRQVDDLHFIVMKFIEGRSMESVLHSTGPLPFDVVRTVLFHVGSGLEYAHRRGVIHRDIKPANILLDAEGNSIVTDFGIAKLAEYDGQTQTGTMIGTPAYMSPEQCFGGPLTWSSDLYSLGIVAYELLTGGVPFSGTPFNVMQAHTATPPPPLRDRRPDCPDDLASAVLRMLAKTPDERFTSMPNALAALGARQPMADDPVRGRLERLAIPDPTARLGPAIRSAHSPIPRAGPRVGQLVISGSPEVVAAGDRFDLTCSVRSDTGASIAGRVVSWSTSNDTVATVTADGVVAARSAGRANISASCEGMLTSLALTILPARPNRSAHRRAAGLAVGGTLITLAAIFGAYRMFGPTPSPALPPPPPAPPPATVIPGAIGRPTVLRAPPSTDGTEAPVPSTIPVHLRGIATAESAHTSTRVLPAAPTATRDTQPERDTPASGAASVPTVIPPPPPAVSAIAPPSSPRPTPAEVTRGVQRAVAAYVAAIRAQNLTQMRSVYPNLSSADAGAWQTQFGMIGHDGVKRLDVVLGQTKVTPAPSGDAASAEFTVKLTLVQQHGPSQSSVIEMRGTLSRDGSSWQFDLLDQQRANR